MALIHLNDIEEQELVDGYFVKFVHSENMTLAYWNIKKGASLPEHTHPHEQVVNIIEGSFKLILNHEPLIIKPGSVVIIPSNAPHSGKALTDCRIIDVFFPVREDYQ